MDDLAVGGKSTSLIGTPGGTQQMTVQHVRDEWRGVGSVPTPGVTTWVTTDVIPPARLQFRTRLPALNFQPGYPRRIFGAATICILRALPSCGNLLLCLAGCWVGIFFDERE